MASHAGESAKLTLQGTIGQVVAHAGGVGEQLMDGDGVRHLRGEARQVGAERLIETELALLRELCHGHTGKRLGHRREREDSVGPVRYRQLLAGQSVRPDKHRLGMAGQQHGAGKQVLCRFLADELVNRAARQQARRELFRHARAPDRLRCGRTGQRAGGKQRRRAEKAKHQPAAHRAVAGRVPCHHLVLLRLNSGPDDARPTVSAR